MGAGGPLEMSHAGGVAASGSLDPSWMLVWLSESEVDSETSTVQEGWSRCSTTGMLRCCASCEYVVKVPIPLALAGEMIWSIMAENYVKINKMSEDCCSKKIGFRDGKHESTLYIGQNVVWPHVPYKELQVQNNSPRG